MGNPAEKWLTYSNPNSSISESTGRGMKSCELRGSQAAFSRDHFFAVVHFADQELCQNALRLDAGGT
jgi:hypothetical protein